MLVCYARELKEGFAAYTEDVVKIMVSHLKFYFHDGKQSRSVQSFLYLTSSDLSTVDQILHGIAEIYRFNVKQTNHGHEPGLTSCSLDNKGCWSEFFCGWDALPLTQPTVPKHWRSNWGKFLQVTRCLVWHPTNGINAPKAKDLNWIWGVILQ